MMVCLKCLACILHFISLSCRWSFVFECQSLKRICALGRFKRTVQNWPSASSDSAHFSTPCTNAVWRRTLASSTCYNHCQTLRRLFAGTFSQKQTVDVCWRLGNITGDSASSERYGAAAEWRHARLYCTVSLIFNSRNSSLYKHSTTMHKLWSNRNTIRQLLRWLIMLLSTVSWDYMWLVKIA